MNTNRLNDARRASSWLSGRMFDLTPSVATRVLLGAVALLTTACGSPGTTPSAATQTASASSAQGQPNVPAQRAAMQKLDFLLGTWSGPETVVTPSGSSLPLTQTEVVQSRLGGLVLLVDGSGRGASGQVVFTALATIAYDDATSTYRFRAYNGGSYLDAPLQVTSQGFSWAYTSGPVRVTNTMQLSPRGEWTETTVTTAGSSPPHKTVDMTLQHQP
jgi:hypothetical protein